MVSDTRERRARRCYAWLPTPVSEFWLWFSPYYVVEALEGVCLKHDFCLEGCAEPYWIRVGCYTVPEYLILAYLDEVPRCN